MRLPYDKLTCALGALSARYGNGGIPREVYVSFDNDAALFRVAGAGAADISFGELPEYPQVFKTSMKHLSAELGAALGAKPPLSTESVEWNGDGSFEVTYTDKSLDPETAVLKITGRVPLIDVSADDVKTIDRVFRGFLPADDAAAALYGGVKMRDVFAAAASLGADWLTLTGNSVYWVGGGGIGHGSLEVTGERSLSENLVISRDFAAVLSRVSADSEDVYLTDRCAMFTVNGVDVRIEIPQERGVELADNLIVSYDGAWEAPVNVTLYTEVASKVHGDGVFEITPKGVMYRDDDGAEYRLDGSYYREVQPVRDVTFVVPLSVSKAYKPLMRLAFADINGKRVAVASGGAGKAKFLMEVGG